MFGHFKVPLIGHVKPKLIQIDDQKAIVRIPLKRRNKNHLNSMYFGVLAVGADLAGGLHGFYHADKAKVKASLAFKSFHADFLKRPYEAVYFVSEDGDMVADMIVQSQQEQKRINQMVRVNAYTGFEQTAEKVATFQLELSIKVENGR
jgi:acyl-coenzyme A thioesterase PaaI-like protein